MEPYNNGYIGYIKAITLLPFPHQRKVHTEGLLGGHALCMVEENTDKHDLTHQYWECISNSSPPLRPQ